MFGDPVEVEPVLVTAVEISVAGGEPVRFEDASGSGLRIDQISPNETLLSWGNDWELTVLSRENGVVGSVERTSGRPLVTRELTAGHSYTLSPSGLSEGLSVNTLGVANHIDGWNVQHADGWNVQHADGWHVLQLD